MKNSLHIYLKNAIVALISAKLSNSDSDVALVSNIDIPAPYKEICKKNSIIIFKEEFDSFCFGNKYKWGLAFYKLCAIKKMVSREYANYLLIDTDTYTISSIDDLWKETADNIMLYDINCRISDKDYKDFINEIDNFCENQNLIIKYGGEFIAANKKNLTIFIKECEDIFEEMIRINFRTNFGDEFITNIAADRLKINVKNAASYIYRYWTGTYYLVSTCHLVNLTSIMHVPSAKEKGMLKLFSYYVKRGKFPKKNRVYRILNLPRFPAIVIIKIYVKKILKKLKK